MSGGRGAAFPGTPCAWAVCLVLVLVITQLAAVEGSEPLTVQKPWWAKVGTPPKTPAHQAAGPACADPLLVWGVHHKTGTAASNRILNSFRSVLGYRELAYKAVCEGRHERQYVHLGHSKISELRRISKCTHGCFRLVHLARDPLDASVSNYFYLLRGKEDMMWMRGETMAGRKTTVTRGSTQATKDYLRSDLLNGDLKDMVRVYKHVAQDTSGRMINVMMQDYVASAEGAGETAWRILRHMVPEVAGDLLAEMQAGIAKVIRPNEKTNHATRFKTSPSAKAAAACSILRSAEVGPKLRKACQDVGSPCALADADALCAKAGDDGRMFGWQWLAQNYPNDCPGKMRILTKNVKCMN
mmetsp:Transcript_54446/g.173014  ORF Transcript_54446/g.173014 Transcript_54446/m.173014 type:complete len:356 (-) Transcript_54446:73-1140(-)